MAANCFKQVLHFPVAAIQKHNIIGIKEVRTVDASNNMNPMIALQGLTKNPEDYVVEELVEGAHPCRKLTCNSKDNESPPLALNFVWVHS